MTKLLMVMNILSSISSDIPDLNNLSIGHCPSCEKGVKTSNLKEGDSIICSHCGEGLVLEG